MGNCTYMIGEMQKPWLKWFSFVLINRKTENRIHFLDNWENSMCALAFVLCVCVVVVVCVCVCVCMCVHVCWHWYVLMFASVSNCIPIHTYVSLCTCVYFTLCHPCVYVTVLPVASFCLCLSQS